MKYKMIDWFNWYCSLVYTADENGCILFNYILFSIGLFYFSNNNNTIWRWEAYYFVKVLLVYNYLVICCNWNIVLSIISMFSLNFGLIVY